MNLDMKSTLTDLGASLVPHTGRSLQDHLLETSHILQSWACDPQVCAAGMFHSIYGTNSLGTTCLSMNDRSKLRDIIGDDAERLVYLFCISDRPMALLHGVVDLRIRDRFSGESIPVTREDIQNLLAIECANLVEQGSFRFIESMLALPPEHREALLGSSVSEGLSALLRLKGMNSDMQTAQIPSDKSLEATCFDKKGYFFFEKLLSRDVLDIAWRYYLSYVGVPGYYDVDGETKALDRYADALGEAMVLKIQPKIEERIGRRLLPTYSFARIYTTESRLTKHVDRGACEISATMTVGYKNTDGVWPIYVESEGVDTPVALDIGDALIYKGMDLPHWRDPLPRGIWCQLFFHFVEATGSMADHKYDRRARLGPV